MITKIKVDGKEHVAIVFDEFTTMEEVQGYKLGICDAITSLLASDSDGICTSNPSLCDVNNLLQQMELSPAQADDYFRSYWHEDNTNQKKSEIKHCEIYI